MKRVQKLAIYLAVAGSAALAQPDGSNWVVDREIDAIEKSKTLVFSTRAINLFDHDVVFLARCWRGETDAYVVWNTQVGNDSGDESSQWKYVDFRVGDHVERFQEWWVSTDGEATFVNGDVVGFLKLLRGADEMAIRIYSEDGNWITAEFVVAGAAPLLDEMTKACDWPS